MASECQMCEGLLVPRHTQTYVACPENPDPPSAQAVLAGRYCSSDCLLEARQLVLDAINRFPDALPERPAAS